MMIPCRRCKNSVYAVPQDEGKKLTCPSCGRTFTASAQMFRNAENGCEKAQAESAGWRLAIRILACVSIGLFAVLAVWGASFKSLRVIIALDVGALAVVAAPPGNRAKRIVRCAIPLALWLGILLAYLTDPPNVTLDTYYSVIPVLYTYVLAAYVLPLAASVSAYASRAVQVFAGVGAAVAIGLVCRLAILGDMPRMA